MALQSFHFVVVSVVSYPSLTDGFVFRWAALASSFLAKATELLAKTEKESDRLWNSLKEWEKEESQKSRSRGKAKAPIKKKKKTTTKNGEGEGEDSEDEKSEVWANVRYTNEFCMAKVDDSPFWPAKKCEVKDEELAASLEKAGRVMVSLIGEKGGLRVVRVEDEIKPFDGDVVEGEDLEAASKADRTQLDDCMVMARRIVRGRKQSSAAGGYQEEKKMAT